MRAILLPLLSLGLCPPAMAACPPTFNGFLSCTFADGRQYLDVCADAHTVTYAFGYAGRPADLALSVPIEQADFEPWPGIGFNIYEIMTFSNANISYVVTAGTTRPTAGSDGNDTEIFGEIEIIANRDDLNQSGYIATLICDEGSSSYTFGGSIHEAKTAAGQCWDYQQKTWGICN